MSQKYGSVEPARPCCFPVLGSPVFTALGSSLNVWLIFSWEGGVFPGSNCQILIDVSEPKRNKNLGFVSTKRTKAASRCQIVTIVTKNRVTFWCKNCFLEPARPCRFPILGQPVFIPLESSLSVRLVVFGAKSYQNQAKTLGLQRIQAIKPEFSIADSDATFDIGGGGNVSQKSIR